MRFPAWCSKKEALALASLVGLLLLGSCGGGQPTATSPAAGPTAADQPTTPPPYRIYVTNEVSGDLSIIDAGTYAVKHIPLGKRPRGIRSSPDGKLIYVALSGSPIAGPGVDESTLPPPDKSADGIGVFDVAQQKLLKVIKAGSDPENFALSHDGKLLYVSNEDISGVSIVDLTTDKLLVTLPTGAEPEGVEMSPNGKFVYVTSEDDGSVAVVDTAAQKIIKTIKVGRRPRNIAFTADSKRAWVNAENDATVILIDCEKHAKLQTIKLGEAGVIKPMDVELSPNGAQLFVSTGRGKMLMTIDTATGKITHSVEVGRRPWGIGLSPDGKLLFTANGPSNDLSVVDLASQSVVKKVPLVGSPWGLITLKN